MFKHHPSAGTALAALFLACPLLAGCMFNPETKGRPPAGQDFGMKLIPAKGRPFQQGDSGKFSRAEEKPVITNRFTDDFWMDPTETTQGQFRSLMGWDPVPAGSPFGKGDSLPVFGVTWYDAVLYCNARSRKVSLDTVYEYASVLKSASGSAYDIRGLVPRLERNGFRLPTEAEWEYAAKAGSPSSFPWGEAPDSGRAAALAWFSGNSGNRTQAVGTRKANAFGLHDMAGNVMEWVNDWKGAYPAAGMADFAGPRDPGPSFEKPVKGGAFKYGMTELRPAGRSATYATIPSAAAEYVGFRCARGAIAAPALVTPDGNPAETDPFALLTARIQSRLEGRAAKLVFVNASATRRRLAYVDYRSWPPRTREFADFDRVFHPSISPDGRWVAFGEVLEGADAPAAIWVRSLEEPSSAPIKMAEGAIPRWWVDPASGETFLIYASSAVDNREPRWGATRTMLLGIREGRANGEPAPLIPDGGFHDGRSGSGRWLATGFRLLKVRDAEAGKTSVLFTAPANGKAPGDTSQVCNVSIAPDSSGRVLFLDFGYAEKSALTGAPYGIHQFAFLAAPDGKVSRFYGPAPGAKAWNDLEWSNHPDYAVGAATGFAGEQREIHLLDLKDSAYAPLAKGTNLLQPALWVGAGPDLPAGFNLDLDSLAAYDDPPTFEGQSILALKMHHFWKLHRDTEVFFLGSSQVADGVDPRFIASARSFNMAFGAGGMRAAEFLARNYVMPHAPKARLAVFSVPLAWFNAPGADISWHQIHPGNRGFMYDSTHGFWTSGLPKGFEKAVGTIPFPDRPHVDSLGLCRFPSLGWGPSVLQESADTVWGLSSPAYKANMAALEKLVADLAAKGVKSMFLVFPQAAGYKGMRSFSSGGPSWTTANAVMDAMRALEKRRPSFKFIDLNRGGDHGYGPEDAVDDSHLSETGARRASLELDPEIKAFLSK